LAKFRRAHDELGAAETNIAGELNNLQTVTQMLSMDPGSFLVADQRERNLRESAHKMKQCADAIESFFEEIASLRMLMIEHATAIRELQN
jgi:hypothetical protein